MTARNKLLFALLACLCSLLFACQPLGPAPATPQLSPTTPATAAPETPSGGQETAQIYLIALEDQGQAGQQIGCGDSLVPVEVQIPGGTDPIQAALQNLLSIEDQYYGQSGLYNALYQSDLQVESVEVDGSGQATVQLSGTLTLGGVCDNPRVQAQLQQTVHQFPGVSAVNVLVNSTPLDELLSEQG